MIFFSAYRILHETYQLLPHAYMNSKGSESHRPAIMSH